MISSSVSKVNPSHLADFAAFRGCSVVEGASVARIVPPAGGIGNACVCQGARGGPLDMSRTHPECLDSDPSDRSVAPDVLLRQEPDDEDDDDEDDEDDDK
jgi:hypothetical protein